MFEDPLVVHYRDGQTFRGYGDGFMPTEREIMVRSLDGAIVTVALSDVKVVCFVRSHATDGLSRNRHPAALLFQGVPGKRVLVLFGDGERLEGIATINGKPKTGFFLTPLNPASNNLQVFVNPEAVSSLQFPSPARGAPA